MTTLTDARFDALRTQLPAEPPTTNDLLFAWALTQGGSGNTLNDRIYSMLISQGADPLHVNDMWRQVLTAQGFTGSLNDQMKAFWEAGGSFSGSIDDNRLLDADNLDEYLLDDTNPDDVYLLDGAPFVTAIPVAVMTQTDFQPNPEGVGGGLRLDVLYAPDGLRAFSARDSSNRMDQHDVSPAFSIAPGTWTNRINIALNDPRWIWWRPDGTRFFWAAGNSIISQLDAGTPFDISTLVAAGTKFQGVQTLDGFMSEDGFTYWGYQSSTNEILERAMTTAFDITTLNLVAVNTFDLTPDIAQIRSFAFSGDGTRLYALGTTLSPGSLVDWPLSVPFDISTAGAFTQGITIGTASEVNVPRGLNVDPTDGSLFVFGDQGTMDKVKIFA